MQKILQLNCPPPHYLAQKKDNILRTKHIQTDSLPPPPLRLIFRREGRGKENLYLLSRYFLLTRNSLQRENKRISHAKNSDQFVKRAIFSSRRSHVKLSSASLKGHRSLLTTCLSTTAKRLYISTNDISIPGGDTIIIWIWGEERLI